MNLVRLFDDLAYDIQEFDRILELDLTNRQRSLLIQHKTLLESMLPQLPEKVTEPVIQLQKVSTSEQKRELYEQGLTDAEICAALDISRQCIQAWRRRNHLPPHEAKPKEDITIEYEKLYTEGLGDSVIAARTHTTLSHVLRWRMENGKLSPREQRMEKAQQLFREGKTIAQVANELDVAWQTASRWHKAFLKEGQISIQKAGWKKIDRERVRALTDAGQSPTEIARELDTTPNTIFAILREFKRKSA